MQSQTLINNNKKKLIILSVKRRTPFVSAQNLHPKYQVQNTKIKKNDRTFLLPICQHKKCGRRFLYYFSVYVNFSKNESAKKKPQGGISWKRVQRYNKKTYSPNVLRRKMKKTVFCRRDLT